MATIPTVSTTFAAGQRLRAIDVNETNAAVNFANTARVCCVYNGAAQTLSTGTPTTFLFPSETSDDYSFHSTSVNTGRITPTLEGWYVVTGSV